MAVTKAPKAAADFIGVRLTSKTSTDGQHQVGLRLPLDLPQG
jgi:hypothetical protein